MLALIYTLLRILSCSNLECHISSDEPERLCLEDTSVESYTSNNSLLDNPLLSNTMNPNTKSVTEPIRNEAISKCINHMRFMLLEPDLQLKIFGKHMLELKRMLLENGEMLPDYTDKLFEYLFFCELRFGTHQTDNMNNVTLYNNCKALLSEVLGTMLKNRDYESVDTNELTLKTTGRD